MNVIIWTEKLQEKFKCLNKLEENKPDSKNMKVLKMPAAGQNASCRSRAVYVVLISVILDDALISICIISIVKNESAVQGWKRVWTLYHSEDKAR